MQESVSMHNSTTPVRQSRRNQARSEEEGKKRGRETGKTEARRLTERMSAQQKKNVAIRGTKTRPN